MKILIPVTINLSAGMVGTEQTDVVCVELEPSIILAGGDELINAADIAADSWGMAKDHAEAYGVEENEHGEFTSYDDPDSTYDPEGYCVGVYNPKEHNCLRGGGGSFLEEMGVQEAYDNYLELVAANV